MAANNNYYGGFGGGAPVSAATQGGGGGGAGHYSAVSPGSGYGQPSGTQQLSYSSSARNRPTYQDTEQSASAYGQYAGARPQGGSGGGYDYLPLAAGAAEPYELPPYAAGTGGAGGDHYGGTKGGVTGARYGNFASSSDRAPAGVEPKAFYAATPYSKLAGTGGVASDYRMASVAAGVENVLFNDSAAGGAYPGRGMAGGGAGGLGGYVPQWSRPGKKSLFVGGGLGGGAGGGMRPRYAPAKPLQLQYCEVCKISCAGTQTYLEHLEGKNHKKKETAAKAGLAASGLAGQPAGSVPRGPGSGRVVHCALCDVACTGADTYAAHIRGTKHQKVLTLHTRLGKPIPELAPPYTAETNGGVAASSKAKDGPAGGGISGGGASAEESGAGGEGSEQNDGANEDHQPVGLEYIEESQSQSGGGGAPVASFFCKLCSCHFTDPLAKVMHSKGRRHRLAYKTKVDPTLVVDMKQGSSSHQRSKLPGGRSSGGGGLSSSDSRHRKQLEDLYRRQVAELRYEKELLKWQLTNAVDRYDPHDPFQLGPGGGCGAYGHHEWGGYLPAAAPPQGTGGGAQGGASSSDDRHVLAKHANIYPSEQDLAAVQTTVSAVEKALKNISDKFAELDAVKAAASVEHGAQTETATGTKDKSALETNGTAAPAADKEIGATPLLAPPAAPRSLKGVMRVGALAKGLLLHADLALELVVLCERPPSKALLRSIAEQLTGELTALSEDKYLVRLAPSGASISVLRDSDPRTTVTIGLTSQAIRDESSLVGTPANELLDEATCLQHLASLRHTKWFQAKASAAPAGVVIMRVLKDFCDRVPTWKPLTAWALELLVEHAVASSATPVSSQGVALRRVFECVSSGLLLPGGPGLLDPCEKVPTDALGALTDQQREHITTDAQHALRMIAFSQMHRVLGMDRLPSPSPRKREVAAPPDSPGGGDAMGDATVTAEGAKLAEGSAATVSEAH